MVSRHEAEQLLHQLKRINGVDAVCICFLQSDGLQAVATKEADAPEPWPWVMAKACVETVTDSTTLHLNGWCVVTERWIDLDLAVSVAIRNGSEARKSLKRSLRRVRNRYIRRGPAVVPQTEQVG